MPPEIANRRDALIALCKRYDVARLEVFGSALRAADFDPARSDVDFLVTFAPHAPSSFAAFLDFKEALEALFGRRVDLIERKSHRGQPQFHPPTPDSGRGRGGLWLSRPTGTPRCCSTCSSRRGTPGASSGAWLPSILSP